MGREGPFSLAPHGLELEKASSIGFKAIQFAGRAFFRADFDRPESREDSQGAESLIQIAGWGMEASMHGPTSLDGFVHAVFGGNWCGHEFPVGGGAVWRGALDGDPVAGAATHDWELRAKAAGRGHTLASD